MFFQSSCLTAQLTLEGIQGTYRGALHFPWIRDSDNIEEFRDWMITGVDGLDDVYKFSQDGFFANEVGDLCARATAKLL